MDILRPTSPAEAVANGAQLLDEKHPGWWRHIDLESLHIGSVTMCVCGQLDVALRGAEIPHWTGFAQSLISPAPMEYQDYGFRETPEWTFAMLNREWRRLIQARLDADQINTKAPAEQEMLLV